jgi:acyl dehydratase
MKRFARLVDLAALVGGELARSPALQFDQARIDAFADATEHRHWIPTHPQRAAQGPFGATIAHGFLTLSLLPIIVRARRRRRATDHSKPASRGGHANPVCVAEQAVRQYAPRCNPKGPKMKAPRSLPPTGALGNFGTAGRY